MIAILNIKSWKQSEKKRQVFAALWCVLQQVLGCWCILVQLVTALLHRSWSGNAFKTTQ